MWADHMPDFVLKVLKDTFSSLATEDDSDSYYSVCKHHDHDSERYFSESGSGYIAVLDSPTGIIWSF